MYAQRDRIVTLGAILLAVSVVAACAPTQSAQLDPNTETEIAETLLSVTNEYNSVWEALDLERIAEHHADDFTYYRRGVVAAASPQEFEQMYHDEVATQITSYRAEASDIRVEVLGPDAGMAAFLFRGEVTTPDGAAHEYSGALTYVFERRDGEWKVAHVHESLLPHIQD